MLIEGLADALCTVVAAGFIHNNSKKTSGPKTEFVYEKAADKEKHEDISARLTPFGVDVTFKEQIPKPVQPIIAAKTKYVFGKEQVAGLADDYNKASRILEMRVNEEIKRKGITVPGAYIGGLLTADAFNFIGPSHLYLYEPYYRNPEVEPKVGESYGKAKAASEFLMDFLKRNRGHVNSTGVHLRLEDIGEIEDYKKDYLFASCHGMIMAMTHFKAPMKDEIWIELALGENTSKVASCLPCSLFMYANASPATATHLGRGDNWNLPPALFPSSRQASLWAENVIRAYQAGIELLARPPIAKPAITALLRWMTDNIGENAYIPRVFLEALTFESSFADKIMAALPR